MHTIMAGNDDPFLMTGCLPLGFRPESRLLMTPVSTQAGGRLFAPKTSSVGKMGFSPDSPRFGTRAINWKETPA